MGRSLKLEASAYASHRSRFSSAACCRRRVVLGGLAPAKTLVLTAGITKNFGGRVPCSSYSRGTLFTARGGGLRRG